MTDLAVSHRTTQLAVRASTLRALLPLWPALDLSKPEDTYALWARAVGQVIAQHHKVSVSVSATYLDQLWKQLGIDAAEIALAPAVVPEQVATSLFVTTVVNYRSSIGRQVDSALAARQAFVASSGAASRLVLNGGRDTITGTAAKDPRRPRWQRVTGASSCSWCRMLADRGGVYKESTVGFQAHDHCGCSASLAY